MTNKKLLKGKGRTIGYSGQVTLILLSKVG